MNNNINNSKTGLFTIVASLCLAVFGNYVAAEQPVLENSVNTIVTPVAHTTLKLVDNSSVTLTSHLNARPREEVDSIRTAAAKPVDPQLKISSRYSDSKMLGFLNRTSMSEMSSLYLEASRMVDARHVNPISYEDRTRSAILGLIQAVENEHFLRANNASINSANIRTLQGELNQLAQGQPARTANEAIGLMQWAAERTNQRLGVRREAVALEFLNATIDSLDNYSAFMPSTAYNTGALDVELRTAAMDFELTAGLEENIVGIGVEMKLHDSGALLTGVVENSPASELGLKEGDIIIAVNQRSIAGQNLNQIADQVAGQSGTSLSVDINRNGQKYRGSLTRRQIYVSSVSGTKMVDQATRTGYVRLKQFSDSTTKDLEAALWTLHKQGMQSLIVDLRGNPGGLLDQAITVSDLFVPRGTIVSTKGRTASDNTSESASYQKTWSTPLVVLVDENSASASEIFGAAIQENGRGVIVGRTSYGKGTVQTHFPMNTVSAHLKLTTAKFYSPRGREMAGSGVTPDVAVNASANTTVTGYRGVDTDADINTALKVIQSGTPRQMLASMSNPNSVQPVQQPIYNNGYSNGGYGQVNYPAGSLR